MRRSGEIVSRWRDADGEITVVDSDDIRYLYFGNEIVQSAIDLLDPAQLVLSYTRAMATGLLFCDSPKSALLIGLGGGALVHFLGRHFPYAQLTVVDQREALFEIASKHFLLGDLTHIDYVASDGLSFLQRIDAQYDVIMVDAFDENGLSPNVASHDFLVACKDRLSERGLLAFNLWRSQTLITEDIAANAHQLFEGHVAALSVQDKGNLILFAGPAVPRTLHWRQLRGRARQHEASWGIELRTLLKQIKPHEASNWWQKVLQRLGRN